LGGPFGESFRRRHLNIVRGEDHEIRHILAADGHRYSAGFGKIRLYLQNFFRRRGEHGAIDRLTYSVVFRPAQGVFLGDTVKKIQIAIADNLRRVNSDTNKEGNPRHFFGLVDVKININRPFFEKILVHIGTLGPAAADEDKLFVMPEFGHFHSLKVKRDFAVKHVFRRQSEQQHVIHDYPPLVLMSIIIDRTLT
jgi:hypothetical protein